MIYRSSYFDSVLVNFDAVRHLVDLPLEKPVPAHLSTRVSAVQRDPYLKGNWPSTTPFVVWLTIWPLGLPLKLSTIRTALQMSSRSA